MSGERACPKHRRLPVVAVAIAALAGSASVTPTAADAATGDLSYVDCITSNSSVAGCEQIAGAAANGTNTGLGALQSVAISADGESLYTASSDGDAVARFERDPTTGVPTYEGCITSNSDVAGCAQIPGAAAGGGGTGLNALRSVAISADGESVYAASAVGDAVARFGRNPTTGALTYEGCITSDSTVATCEKIGAAATFGVDTGLDQLQSVAVSADGKSVYAASGQGDAVARFDRNATTGALNYQGCITSNSDVNGCSSIPVTNTGGSNTGLDQLLSVAVSADGRNLYAASARSDAVARFARNPTTGSIAYQGCITSDSNVSCEQIAGAAAFGANTGLDVPRAVAISAEGKSVYTASAGGDAVARFDRDPTTGALTYQGCLTSDSNVSCEQIAGAAAFGFDTGLSQLHSVAVSADGESVYAASAGGDAVAGFARDPTTGALAYRGCTTSDSDVGGCTHIAGAVSDGTDTGLNALSSVAVSADGESVYAASDSGDAVARFDREAPADGAPPGGGGDGDGGGDGGGRAPDTTPPELEASAKKRQRAGKPIKVKVRSDEDVRAVGSGKVIVVLRRARRSGAEAAGKRKRKFKLRTVSKRIAAGETEVLKLRPKKKRAAKQIRRLVRGQGGKGKAKVKVTGTDAAGNVDRERLAVKLKP